VRGGLVVAADRREQASGDQLVQDGEHLADGRAKDAGEPIGVQRQLCIELRVSFDVHQIKFCIIRLF
jgi:hypothetical protein